MESRVKLFGHPIHPILIVFPLGLFATAVILDIIYLFNGNTALVTVSFWNIIVGIIGGLLAALFGLADWLAIPSGTRAKAVGLWHGAGNVVIVALFFIAWLLRLNEPGNVPGTTAFILEIIGVGLALITGWLGGELVDRLGVGVDRGANLNASSSLSGRPAQETSSGTPPAVS